LLSTRLSTKPVFLAVLVEESSSYNKVVYEHFVWPWTAIEKDNIIRLRLVLKLVLLSVLTSTSIYTGLTQFATYLVILTKCYVALFCSSHCLTFCLPWCLTVRPITCPFCYLSMLIHCLTDSLILLSVDNAETLIFMCFWLLRAIHNTVILHSSIPPLPTSCQLLFFIAVSNA
jgi:hypothetical protein